MEAGAGGAALSFLLRLDSYQGMYIFAASPGRSDFMQEVLKAASASTLNQYLKLDSVGSGCFFVWDSSLPQYRCCWHAHIT